jgi:hypothetical protein
MFGMGSAYLFFADHICDWQIRRLQSRWFRVFMRAFGIFFIATGLIFVFTLVKAQP